MTTPTFAQTPKVVNDLVTINASCLYLNSASSIHQPETQTLATIAPKIAVRRISSPDIAEKIRIVSERYGLVSEMMINVAYCESGLRHEGVWGDDFTSYGCWQFQRKTFDRYCAGNWFNFNDQTECAAKMFSNGLAPHWTCFKQLYL